MLRVGQRKTMKTGETVEVTGREWRGNAKDAIVIWVKVVNPGRTEMEVGTRFWMTANEVNLNTQH